ncbi:MAG TPA: UDP-3-O-(3-hydroxymyristoyl)glucosamine N-acyltransferase, partial [Steroidobacteraceae bacterium]|nr:UDP-3-O-(3-hydroxymyristoyl)glucosamine N-acyltransferase [Steroidobacteraceae bacterium]
MRTVDQSLGELAVRFGLVLRGDPDLRVSHVATLAGGSAGALAFLANARYRRQLEATRATAVVLAAEDAPACPVAALIGENPYLAYARIADLLHPQPAAEPGVHPTAVVSSRALVPRSAAVAAFALVEDGAEIGERAFIGPGCVVQRDARIGADTRLLARATVCAAVRVGARCLIHPGAVIGSDGFGFARDGGAWAKVPQLGTVRVGDDVEIGANTTIDRGAIDDTVIEDGVKLDNQIQVGHNVTIGAHTAIAACTGISGSTTIGKRCMIGGMVGFAGHLTIADDVAVTGCSLVSASIRESGSYSSGIPVAGTREWRRTVAQLRRLDRAPRSAG